MEQHREEHERKKDGTVVWEGLNLNVREVELK